MKAFQLKLMQVPPEMPRRLYKFSGPTEYALQNLESGALFCQHYSAYNDPFEFWSRIHDGMPELVRETDRFQAAKQAWGAGFMADNDAYLKEYFKSCTENQPSFRNWMDKVRIACFGSEPDSLLMWSHYGDGLRGFSIVFDETELLEQEGKGFVVDVDYVMEPPVCDAFVWAVADGLVEYNETELEELSGRHSSVRSEGMLESEIRSELDRSLLLQQNILRALFASKPIEWQYERERRFLFQANIDGTEPILASFPERAIQAVLIGERMPSDYQRRLEAVLSRKYRHAKIQTVKRSLTEYRLVVD